MHDSTEGLEHFAGIRTHTSVDLRAVQQNFTQLSIADHNNIVINHPRHSSHRL
ncbi:MAG: hypothetical protein ACREV9_09050 [Burkholderiales bacterium]